MSDITKKDIELNSRFTEAYYALKVRKKAGKKSDFCLSIGLASGSFSRYETNERAVPVENLKIMAKIYPVSENWLLYNQGTMFDEEQAKGGQTAYAGRDIGVQAGRDVTQGKAGNNDCESKLAAAMLRIEDLEARLKDKDQTIATKDQLITVLMQR